MDLTRGSWPAPSGPGSPLERENAGETRVSADRPGPESRLATISHGNGTTSSRQRIFRPECSDHLSVKHDTWTFIEPESPLDTQSIEHSNPALRSTVPPRRLRYRDQNLGTPASDETAGGRAHARGMGISQTPGTRPAHGFCSTLSKTRSHWDRGAGTWRERGRYTYFPYTGQHGTWGPSFAFPSSHSLPLFDGTRYRNIDPPNTRVPSPGATR